MAPLESGPPRFVIGAASEKDVVAIRQEVEKMRTSGELDEIIRRMRLD